MKLMSISETLTREVAMPDQAHKGVTFSSPSFKASTITLDFARWVDMGYPNQIVVTVARAEPSPANSASAVRKSA